jgi:hypothetical protein
MRAALDEVMTKVSMEQATPGVKAALAECILKAGANGQTSYDGLIAAASGQIQTILSMLTWVTRDFAAVWGPRQLRSQSGRLKGETAADLPVQQATKIYQSQRQPRPWASRCPSLLGRADEVIEWTFGSAVSLFLWGERNPDLLCEGAFFGD